MIRWLSSLSRAPPTNREKSHASGTKSQKAWFSATPPGTQSLAHVTSCPKVISHARARPRLWSKAPERRRPREERSSPPYPPSTLELAESSEVRTLVFRKTNGLQVAPFVFGCAPLPGGRFEAVFENIFWAELRSPWREMECSIE